MTRSTVAIHIPDLRGGGAERMMVHLANEFASQDISTDLVLSRFKGPYCSEVNENVNIVDLDASRYPGYAAMGAYRPLRNYIKLTQPDALLSALTRANVVALLAHRTAGVDTRMVASERNHLSSIVEKSENTKIRALPLMARCTYRWADAVVPISEGVGDDLVETASVNRQKMTTIYNPAFDHSIPDRAEESPDHPWFEEDEDEFATLLAVGSLSRQKDFPTLLRAFARIQNRRPARLTILGEGDKRNELEALTRDLGIQDYVSFPGFVDNPFSYMARADVFVLSSEWEGFGNVLVEAMACGTPVVSTDCPSGPSEILCDGKYGPLVPIGDHVALADSIKETLDDPIDSETLQKRANDFSVEEIAEQYLDVLLPDR